LLLIQRRVMLDNLADTVRLCVVCNGTGLLTVESINRYEGLLCIWCDHTGVMTNIQYFRWKLKQQRLQNVEK
jgi:hypothetical protein